MILPLSVVAFAIAPHPQEIEWNERKLFVPGLESRDDFGRGVSLQGDRALVGARWDDDLGNDAGAAYVFRRNATTKVWELEQKLLASDGVSGDRFGLSVSIDGEFALIGAHLHKELGGDAGAAYVFRFDRGSGSWLEEAKLLAPDGGAGDSFGRAVSLSGDVALVGVRYEPAAWVFRRNPLTQQWQAEQKLVPSDGFGLGFGYSVAAHRNNLLVGARIDSQQASEAGAAYLYSWSTSSQSWNLTQKLTASDAGPHHHFGVSASLYGELALIGADDAEGVVPGAGAAYVFRQDPASGAWLQEAKFFSPTGDSYDRFGYSVSVFGGDSALVGAIGDDQPNGNSSGAAYLYRYDHAQESWAQDLQFFASDGQPGDQLGVAVSLDQGNALLGAWTGSTSAPSSGASYVVSPYLVASKSKLRASQSSNVDFLIDFPGSQAGKGYAMLASLSGVGPTTVPNNVQVPLTDDSLFFAMLAGDAPRNWHDAYGLLDSNGNASSRLQVDSGTLAGLVGSNVWCAAISWKFEGLVPVATRSSRAVSVYIEP